MCVKGSLPKKKKLGKPLKKDEKNHTNSRPPPQVWKKNNFEIQIFFSSTEMPKYSKIPPEMPKYSKSCKFHQIFAKIGKNDF